MRQSSGARLFFAPRGFNTAAPDPIRYEDRQPPPHLANRLSAPYVPVIDLGRTTGPLRLSIAGRTFRLPSPKFDEPDGRRLARVRPNVHTD
jgi:hypothetical protein